MSYDIWATVEPAPNRFTTYLDLGNITSNVAPMWRAACPSLDGLAGIDGKTGAEVSERLQRGLRFMYKQRRKLEDLNPENGWGNFPAAFRYFAAVARAARDHPDAVFGVDR
jgi:hypothetical protein